MDFISNSSSTSFVYISDKDFTEASFFKAVGVNDKSPMFDFFKDMYNVIDNAIHSGQKVMNADEIKSEGEYPDFTPEVVERVNKAIKDKKTVIKGRLSSDEILPEMILCTEIFEIESEDFYLNAYNNIW